MWTLFNDGMEASSAPVIGRNGRRRWSFSLLVSAVIHGVALVVFCWPAAPFFVKPRLLAHGEGGTSAPASVTFYLPQDAALARPDHHFALLSLPVPARKPQQTKLKKRSNDLESNKPSDSAEVGPTLGSALNGPAEGNEIKPGFAISFTAPRVSRWELPSGTQGDVIVELTIDEQGNVVEEKLLLGIGHGIDERVIATLRDWHFRPATKNGVAIPFKYDARFHFPS